MSKDLYLDLLKRCLLDTIYGPLPIEDKKVQFGLNWPERAHTMIGLKRLSNIQYCFENVVKDGIEGDLIETGVWRGGATIFMKALVNLYQEKRKVYVADSFEGLPKPDPRYPVDKGDKHHTFHQLAVDLPTVRNNFRKYGLLDRDVIFVKGFFEDTIPHLDIDKLSILRLDGDMFSSTIHVLEPLYDKLSVGGYVIIDDYNLKGAKSAVMKFRADRNISSKIVEIDMCGAYWRKE